MLLPATPERVPKRTADPYNRRIQRDIRIRLYYFAQHRDRIDGRLRELDAEWDIERALEANASALAFTGTAIAVLASRRWLVLPLAVTGFLFQHALQGWCPPLPVLRRVGFRTAREIDEERMALKALRGDFNHVAQRVRRAESATGHGPPRENGDQHLAAANEALQAAQH